MKTAWNDFVKSHALDTISRSTARCYRRVVPVEARLKVAAARYRLQGHEGVGDPFRVYPIDPADVTHEIRSDRFGRRVPYFGIVNGNWHERVTPLEESGTYRMLVAHFDDNVPWEETEHFNRVREKLERGERHDRLDSSTQSVAKFRDYLSYLDDLHRTIREDGYKRQTKLEPEDDFCSRNRKPFLNEIQVCVGPDGEIFHKTGGHRLAIAKVLELDEIPVRTRVRHLEWQLVRNSLADPRRADDELVRCYRSHPEVQDLLRASDRTG